MSAKARRRRRGSAIVWAVELGAMLVIVLGFVFSARFGTDPTKIDSPLIGETVPTVQLLSLDGGDTVDLGGLLQGRIGVVNFFASWCIPCRDELVALRAVQERYAAQGVQVLGIVYQDDPIQVRAWLASLGGSNYPAFVDPGSRAAIDFGVYGIPETFFVDRNGTVVAKIFGAADEASLSSILDLMLVGQRPDSIETGGTQSGPGG